MQSYFGAARQEGGGPLRGLPSRETDKRVATARYVEPIGNIAKELRGFVEGADGSRTHVSARISEPMQSIGYNDHYCIVHCPHLFHEDKKIFGVDEDQALELSIMFIKKLLYHASVVLVEEEPSEPSE